MSDRTQCDCGSCDITDNGADYIPVCRRCLRFWWQGKWWKKSDWENKNDSRITDTPQAVESGT